MRCQNPLEPQVADRLHALEALEKDQLVIVIPPKRLEFAGKIQDWLEANKFSELLDGGQVRILQRVEAGRQAATAAVQGVCPQPYTAEDGTSVQPNTVVVYLGTAAEAPAASPCPNARWPQAVVTMQTQKDLDPVIGEMVRSLALTKRQVADIVQRYKRGCIDFGDAKDSIELRLGTNPSRLPASQRLTRENLGITSSAAMEQATSLGISVSRRIIARIPPDQLQGIAQQDARGGWFVRVVELNTLFKTATKAGGVDQDRKMLKERVVGLRKQVVELDWIGSDSTANNLGRRELDSSGESLADLESRYDRVCIELRGTPSCEKVRAGLNEFRDKLTQARLVAPEGPTAVADDRRSAGASRAKYQGILKGAAADLGRLEADLDKCSEDRCLDDAMDRVDQLASKLNQTRDEAKGLAVSSLPKDASRMLVALQSSRANAEALVQQYLPSTAPKSKGMSTMKIAGIAVLAVGAAAIVGGGVLVGVGESTRGKYDKTTGSKVVRADVWAKASCGGSVTGCYKDGNTLRYAYAGLRDLKTWQRLQSNIGYGLLGAGAAVAITGGVLWVVDYFQSKETPKKVSIIPSVGVGRNGAVVSGLQGSF
jgi:hypothetical protein